MNIRVDLNYPINDGVEVVFRSPVDCSQVTGLKVYCPGVGGNTAVQEFAFADAHGNNVGDIDHLFAENVVVKVILDVTNGMAFVQNADTNAYLENKFAETIKMCCPSFTESGAVVTCNPVEGYPLDVITHIPTTEAGVSALKLHHTGKNLWDFKSGLSIITYESSGSTTQVKTYGYIVELPAGTYTISAEATGIRDFSANPGYIYSYRLNSNNKAIAGYSGNILAGSIFKPSTITLEQGQRIMIIYPNSANRTQSEMEGLFYDSVNIQIEAGTVATPYEPYCGEVKTVNFGTPIYGGNYNWTTGLLTEDGGQEHQFEPQAVNAHSGTNFFCSNVGETEVKGYADINVVLQKLMAAMTALTGG